MLEHLIVPLISLRVCSLFLTHFSLWSATCINMPVCVRVPVYMHARSLQSCPALCDPMDCSPLGSCVHGILQARILEWLPCPPPGHLPNPGTEPISLTSPALAGEVFTTSATWEAP